MRAVALDELEKRLADHVRLVGRGAAVIVADVGRPVARLVPPAEDPADR